VGGGLSLVQIAQRGPDRAVAKAETGAGAEALTAGQN